MDIVKHITAGLYSHPEVVVPGFGKFVGQRKEAYVVGDTVYPPSKKILFTLDPHSFALDLATRIATAEGISEDQAAKALQEFVLGIHSKLAAGQSVTLEGIGTFTPGEEGKVVFEQNDFTNLLAESFAMEPVALAAPVTKKTKETAVPTVVVTERRSNPLVWLWWTLFGAALVLIGVAVWWIFFRTDQLNSMQYTELESKQLLAQQDSLLRAQKAARQADSLEALQKQLVAPDSEMLAKADTAANNQQPVKQPENISEASNVNEAFEKQFSRSSQIYLIVGSFQQRNNAEQFKTKLAGEGYESEIIPGENGFHRVTIGRFPNAPAAITVFDRFTKEYPSIDIWAL